MLIEASSDFIMLVMVRWDLFVEVFPSALSFFPLWHLLEKDGKKIIIK